MCIKATLMPTWTFTSYQDQLINAEFSQNNDLNHFLNPLCAEYRLISKKGEGTFSEVLKAQSTKTNKYVAIKCMKAHFYNID